VAAALLHGFSKCKGIEILQGLYEVSTHLKTAYDSASQDLTSILPTLTDVEFEHGSFFEVSANKIDWSDAAMVFANSTCFSSEMMRRIAQSKVAPGTIALTLTKNFSASNWETLTSFRKQMSWGEATVFIQRRKAEDATTTYEEDSD
jgi:hypothetical protein